MAIISRIGRKSFRVRLLLGVITGVLLLGAVSMVYPFLLMISGSTKSAVDVKDFDIWPRFLHDDELLYRKHIEGLYNESLSTAKISTGSDSYSFETFPLPEEKPAELLNAWKTFLEEEDIGPDYFLLGYLYTPVSKTLPRNLRAFKREMIRRFDGDIVEFNQDTGAEFVGWNAFFVLPRRRYLRRETELTDRLSVLYNEFKMGRPYGERVYFSIPGFYRNQFLKNQYTREIAAYNESHGTDYPDYASIRLSRTLPEGSETVQADWLEFTRSTLGLLWITIDPSATTDYRHFLEAKYGNIETVNRNYQAGYGGFADIQIPDKLPQTGLPTSDWAAFLQGWDDPDTGVLHEVQARHLRLDTLDFRFQDFLAARYGDLAGINNALGTAYASPEEIEIPQEAMHWEFFLAERTHLKSEFILRNYRAVIDYMVLHGRGIVNTVIYCILAIIAALTVNPLAAYAMSRYKLPSSYTLLLIMLLTMAFPPMVTQIPVFLMLRDFNLLNTFAALILPGLAHGYSIFLLKGFFDALPKELYESADIDGANEWVMFWNITMTLSKPILAVIALQAFNLAYSNFMFALLICQDESMWTLMVWLYQLQQRSGPAVVYASLIIASVPTFVIFLFCQNIIMRGIVVPVEK